MSPRVLKSKATEEGKYELGESNVERDNFKMETIQKTVSSLGDKTVSLKSIINRLIERRTNLQKIVSDRVYEGDYYYAGKWKSAIEEDDRLIYELIEQIEK